MVGRGNVVSLKTKPCQIILSQVLGPLRNIKCCESRPQEETPRF